MLRIILSVCFTSVFFHSCFYDKEELLYMTPDSDCDTINVSYSATISPIISTYCLSCHGNSVTATNGNNIKLENYTDLKVQVDNGKFRGAVFHEPGFSEMPKNAGMLNTCQLNQINTWLNAGAPNN